MRMCADVYEKQKFTADYKRVEGTCTRFVSQLQRKKERVLRYREKA